MRLIYRFILALFLAFFFTLLLSVPINVAFFILGDETMEEIEMFAVAIMLPLWLAGLVAGYIYFRYKSKEEKAWGHRLPLPTSVMPRLCESLLVSTSLLFLIPLAFYLFKTSISQSPALLAAICFLVYLTATYCSVTTYRRRENPAKS